MLALQATLLLALLVGAIITSDGAAFGGALLSGAVAWVAMFLYALSGGMGFGDGQLLGTAALVLGWVSWQASEVPRPVLDPGDDP